ncbi:hypothetical protein ACFQYP_26760 [Nonomuraea antimicrobica]
MTLSVLPMNASPANAGMRSAAATAAWLPVMSSISGNPSNSMNTTVSVPAALRTAVPTPRVSTDTSAKNTPTPSRSGTTCPAGATTRPPNTSSDNSA